MARFHLADRSGAPKKKCDRLCDHCGIGAGCRRARGRFRAALIEPKLFFYSHTETYRTATSRRTLRLTPCKIGLCRLDAIYRSRADDFLLVSRASCAQVGHQAP